MRPIEEKECQRALMTRPKVSYIVASRANSIWSDHSSSELRNLIGL